MMNDKISKLVLISVVVLLFQALSIHNMQAVPSFERQTGIAGRGEKIPPMFDEAFARDYQALGGQL